MKIRRKKICPVCGCTDAYRAKRPFAAKYVLFFLPLRAYECSKCGSQYLYLKRG